MDSDEEAIVFVGTPIEREEENTSRKKKALAQASGHLRTLVPWKQEVRDEEGRRRFHGAFTGGYSAGYYNTVGSKEGWTPQSFTSSRKNRADVKQQSVLNFLDDDEKVEMEGNLLGTSAQFDTFGFTAAEYARKEAENEQKQRPAPIPGPVPDEILLPAVDSIGVKLLCKMGWRRGRSIKAHSKSLQDARREGRKTFLALSSHDSAMQNDSSEIEKNDSHAFIECPVDETIKSSESKPVHLCQPKLDMHGLGYDPYKHAPEFREKKTSGLTTSTGAGNRKPFSIKDDLLSSRSGRVGPGFGIGALEELDVEDEDVYSSGYNFEETCVQEEVEEPSRLAIEHKETSIQKVQGRFPTFRTASNSAHQSERFSPPIVPEDFVPHHKFLAPLEVNNKVSCSPPPEVPPPEDNNCKMTIDGVASLVARCGKLFEDLSREKNQSNPLFSFLSGGPGSDYYARRLWEEQQKRIGQPKLIPGFSDEKSSSHNQKLTAEDRGRVLGEKPLERSYKESSSVGTSSSSDNSQFNLSDTFTTPESLNQLFETAKPFKDDPAKQERFEQFLRAKYKGGLRSTNSSGASNMSEAARARERLDFEAAAEAIEKSKRAEKGAQPMDFSMSSRLQFTSAGIEEKSSQVEDLASVKLYPKREEFQWRPAPLLCKRFDIIDPFMGKPAAAPRMRSKMESFSFTPAATKVEEEVGVLSQSSSLQFNSSKISTDTNNAENDVPVEAENVERPVDLYKAIFSDDSEDDEEEMSNLNEADEPQKKVEAATATFSRLVAGDFLESLGKELGMEVPPNLPLPVPPPNSSPSQGRTQVVETAKPDTRPTSAALKATDKPDRNARNSPVKRKYQSDRSSSEDTRSEKSRRHYKNRTGSRDRDRKAGSSSGRHDYDSGDEHRSKKKSRQHSGRSSSRSPDSKKRSREKSHTRKHSSSSGKRSREDSSGGFRSRDRSVREEKVRKRD